MKKFFSIFAALLFAGSMMAVNFTLSSADAVTVEDVTVTFAKGDGNNAPAWYDNGLRLYANNTVTVSSESAITAITFNWQQQGSKAFNTVTASVGEYTHPEAAGEGKWTGSATSVTFTLGASGQLLLNTFTVTLAEGEEPVEPGDEPTVLQAVKDSTTWDFSKITANTENALYNKEGIQLTDESTPSKNDEVIYADYSEDFMTIGEDFNKAAIAFKGEYPIRKNQYCQAGTLHFKADVSGTIVVKFSDTGSSASATAVKRYLVVNDEQTEYWTSRENNGETPYDAQLNVVSDKIAVPAGDVTITGSSAIVVHYVTFVPEKQVEPEGPKNLGAKTIAEFLALKNTKDTCILTGVVSNIKNEEYGNFDLVDETGSVYIYGLLTPEGESKKFADLNVAEKDTLTVLAIYNEYNGNPQAKNAIFVEVKKAAVEPGDTIKLVFDNGGVDNYYYANYGSTDIQLYNIPVVGGKLQGDGDFIQLEIYPADPNDISGEYSIEDEGLDDYYTYLLRISGNDTTEIEFVAGSITVSVQNPDKENSSADLTVQGELKTAEGDVYVINSTLNVYYNFTISEEEKYTLDEAEADFNYNFDTYQLMPTGNDIIVGVFAQTDEALIAATIVLPQGQTELVAGEYEVSVMPMYGTVMAGQYTAEGPQPSYALTNDGKLWYIVSGKVTVEGDGSIVIDALNSNGKAIKSTLDHLQGMGIEDVNAAKKVTKSIINGQLIIEKNGVRYNVNGQRIK